MIHLANNGLVFCALLVLATSTCDNAMGVCEDQSDAAALIQANLEQRQQTMDVQRGAASAAASASAAAGGGGGHEMQGTRVPEPFRAVALRESQSPPTPLEGTLPFHVDHCTKADGCTTHNLHITLDQNWRWFYHPDTYQNCENCDVNNCTGCVISADVSPSKYETNYGVILGDDNRALTLKYPTGTRLYLLG